MECPSKCGSTILAKISKKGIVPSNYCDEWGVANLVYFSGLCARAHAHQISRCRVRVYVYIYTCDEVCNKDVIMMKGSSFYQLGEG